MQYTDEFLDSLKKLEAKNIEYDKMFAKIRSIAGEHFKHGLSLIEAKELFEQLQKDNILVSKNERTTSCIGGARVEKIFKVYSINQEAMMNTYFSRETLEKLTSGLSADEVLEELALELRQVTNGKADITLSKLTDDEAVKLFGKKHFDDNYTIAIRYVKDGDQKRNKFCAISYADDTYPLLIIYLKTDEQKVVQIKTATEFKSYLRKVLKEQAVVASVHSAMRLENKPENFSEINILRRLAEELLARGDYKKVLSPNSVTFLEYWKNNYTKNPEMFPYMVRK